MIEYNLQEDMLDDDDIEGALADYQDCFEVQRVLN